MSRIIIYNKKTGEVASNMGPMDSNKALRVLSGTRINLDHANWVSTEVEDAFDGKFYPASRAPKAGA